MSTCVCKIACLAEKVKVMSYVTAVCVCMSCVHTPTQQCIVRCKGEGGHTVVKDLTGLIDF